MGVFEELCLFFPNALLVNSQYTHDMFIQSFSLLTEMKTLPIVLHPSFDQESCLDILSKCQNIERAIGKEHPNYALSVNRFE